MTTVNSVLGPLSPDALGFTLMHEHIILTPAGVSRDYPELLGPHYTDRIIHSMLQAKAEGIETIVDATTLDLGRDVNLLAEVSRRSGINIIACTGWWLETPHFLPEVSAPQLAQVFVREIREGISGTNIKAGILKAASDMPGVTEWQATVLRAVAQAHLLTNVPIMLHSYAPGRVGEQQLAILKEEGVDPSRVKIDHCNDTTDLAYLTWLLEQGCYLGMDRYPGNNVNLIDRTKTMKKLIDAGYADRLLPSHDWSLAYIRGNTPAAIEFHEEKARLNPHGYLYFKKTALPQLREMGVPDSILRRLCIAGPRNFFEGVSAHSPTGH